MTLPEPFCEFCRKKVKGKYVIDYDELHAIECGIGDGLLVVAPMKYSYKEHKADWHYYILARGITTMLIAAFCLWRFC